MYRCVRPFGLPFTPDISLTEVETVELFRDKGGVVRTGTELCGLNWHLAGRTLGLCPCYGPSFEHLRFLVH